jgi:DNA-binding SARP family transcriptional activator
LRIPERGGLLAAVVRVWLIGGLRVEVDGAAVELPRGARARAVLAWLALHPGVHRRTEVAARFWPDVLDASARNSLRGALVAIRDAVGPATLTATRDTVGVVPGPELWVDALCVHDRYASGDLVGALELGDGELLADLEDDWARDAREEHRRLIADTLARLAGDAERRGDLPGAIGWSRRLVAHDALSEEAHRQLMRRLAAAGDRAAAIVVYERLAERLRPAGVGTAHVELVPDCGHFIADERPDLVAERARALFADAAP